MSPENSPGKEELERQRWEYTFLSRSRGIKGSAGAALGALVGATRDYAEATLWDDLESKANDLGENGWELVGIVPRSSIAGTVGAGFTTDELWVFKRPKDHSYGQIQSAERIVETGIFSPEAREALEKKGYLIYPLQGKSMRLMWKQRGEPRTNTLSDLEQESLGPPFWTATTRATEVAINPNQLFFPNSNDKTFASHQKMAALFSEEISDDIRGTKAIIGEASNYVELALLHRDRTKNNLFSVNGEPVYVVTNSKYELGIGDAQCLIEVGEDKNGKLNIAQYWLITAGKSDTWLMPLVVPS